MHTAIMTWIAALMKELAMAVMAAAHPMREREAEASSCVSLTRDRRRDSPACAEVPFLLSAFCCVAHGRAVEVH